MVTGLNCEHEFLFHLKIKLPAWGAVFIYLENRKGGISQWLLEERGL